MGGVRPADPWRGDAPAPARTRPSPCTASAGSPAAVAIYLAQRGITRDCLETRGAGQEEPIDTNKTEAGRRGNIENIGRFQHPNTVGDVNVGGKVTQVSADGGDDARHAMEEVKGNSKVPANPRAIEEMLPNLKAVRAARTPITQSGHIITRIQLPAEMPLKAPLGSLEEMSKGQIKRLYEDYGLTSDRNALHMFDIYLELAPTRAFVVIWVSHEVDGHHPTHHALVPRVLCSRRRVVLVDAERGSLIRQVEPRRLAGAIEERRYFDWCEVRSEESGSGLLGRKDVAQRVGATIVRPYYSTEHYAELSHPRCRDLPELLALYLAGLEASLGA